MRLNPRTIAILGPGAGAANPFDILPAVWITTLFSCVASVGVGLLLKRKNKKKPHSDYKQIDKKEER